MIRLEEILSLEKESIPEASKGLNREEISHLVTLLSEKDDRIRYQALLLLQSRSQASDDVYPFWDIFYDKLTNENSYQRSIGLMMISDNVKWDTENKMDAIMDSYLIILKDEKPITVRQCIQSLSKLVRYKPNLIQIITNHLMAINLMEIKETMRKSVLQDILTILIQIKKIQPMSSIDTYIVSALMGGILDKKTIKMVEQEMLR